MTEIALRPGEWTMVRLPGLGTAGYRWLSTVTGPAGVVTVSLGTAPLPPGSAIGTSVDETATISALAPGTVTVTLSQRRVWEDRDPRDSRTYTVRVRSDDDLP